MSPKYDPVFPKLGPYKTAPKKQQQQTRGAPYKLLLPKKKKTPLKEQPTFNWAYLLKLGLGSQVYIPFYFRLPWVSLEVESTHAPTLIYELLQPKEWCNYQSKLFTYVVEPNQSHLVTHCEWHFYFLFLDKCGSWWKRLPIERLSPCGDRVQNAHDSDLVCVGGKCDIWDSHRV